MDFSRMVKDFVLKGLVNNVGKFIAVPAVASGLIFVANLVQALSDGVLTDDEFHSLVSLASGGETVLLVLVMALLKVKK